MASTRIVKRTQLGERIDIVVERLVADRLIATQTLVYRPSSVEQDAPVVVVMHGVNRCSDHYLATWLPLADEHRFLLVIPEFDRAQWRSTRSYNIGNTIDRKGRPKPQQDWAFTHLEAVVDSVLDRLAHKRRTFSIYGHSAGAQFVHRYLIVTGGSRIEAVIAANAGWYTMIDREWSFPYGIENLPANLDCVVSALMVPLTILLGTEDVGEADEHLRSTPEAHAQGPHRLARGRAFHGQAQNYAAAHRLACAWTIHELAGAGHNDRDTAEWAARHFANQFSDLRATSGTALPANVAIPVGEWFAGGLEMSRRRPAA